MHLQDKRAISEVNEILSQLDNDALEKIPKKLLDSFKENAGVDVSYIKRDIPLEDLNLQPETKEILAVISFNYLCDEEEKEYWNQKFKENEIKYQEELRKKYSVDNLFGNENDDKKDNINIETNNIGDKSKTDIDNNLNPAENIENVALVEYKESFLKKMINKLKNLLKHRK